MKRIIFSILFSISTVYSQIEIEKLGLDNQWITSLNFNYGILAVGTNGNGVYWTGFVTTSSFWNHIEFEDKNIRTVYPHKSGPLGWAIGAGIRPEENDTNYVYCSYLGETFRPINNGIDPGSTSEISALDGFPDPTICGETFAAGGRKLYRRFFGDTVWHPVYELTVEGNFTTVRAKTNYPTVLAGGGEGFANHFLIKSYDKGDTWEYISPNVYVHSLDFTDDSAKVIFVTDIFRILKSEDYGNTWTEVFNTDHNFLINKLHYSSYSNTIYAAGTTDWDTGGAVIYYNKLDSDEWKNLQINIDNPIVGIDEGPENWIYLATPDSGVFIFKDLLVNVQNKNFEISNKFLLNQNYPNPFNPTTTIKYSLPKDEKRNMKDPLWTVSLSVYDILGRKVAILLEDKQNPGEYEVEWDASDLPNGIYFYQLSVEDYSISKKMVLLK